jgi:MYXO-CTERM domain-containing protein
MHLAAGFSSGTNEVVFADETTPYGETVWRFVLFEGSTEEAVARAQALNLTPKVEITCSNDNYDKGCRCSSTGSQKGVWWLGVLPLIGLLRRRS